MRVSCRNNERYFENLKPGDIIYVDRNKYLASVTYSPMNNLIREIYQDMGIKGIEFNKQYKVYKFNKQYKVYKFISKNYLYNDIPDSTHLQIVNSNNQIIDIDFRSYLINWINILVEERDKKIDILINES